MNPYLVGQPGHRGLRVAFGRQAAVAVASGLARRTGRLSHIHAAVGRTGHVGFFKGKLLAIVAPNGAVELHGALYGMGDILTDMACSETEIARIWRERTNGALSAGAQAAIAGAAAAGLIGAIVKRPLIAAAAGAAVGWTSHAIWTAPHAFSE